ncbi:DUF2326 domain-containing protein [Maridesulfovibrio zosterae]|uniref:DUF2326 domain-containing protein n=1 Tax=Maridesulfovibrio zosterae TaxID=82171 RepID=UPI0004107DF7|nr:DUF2326 domain-containing protein [Maridesulfovibrio zosterae]
MILSRVYAKGGPFKEIRFHKGVNIVMGTCTRQGEEGADSHNLGKTILFDVINFTLLGDVSSKHVFVKNSNFFDNYTFYIEIQLKDGTYVTVKRGVASRTVASIIATDVLIDGREIEEWPYENIGLAIRKSENSREILKRILKLNSLEDLSLRSLLTYSIRTQDDYAETFNIFNEKVEIAWKPALLNLVGLDGELLREKLNLDQGEKAIQKTNKILKDTGVYDSPEVENAKTRISELHKQKNKIEQSIGSVSFFDEDEKISRSVVKDYDSQISKLNVHRYNTQFDVDKLSRTADTDYVDLDEINAIYKEAEVAIPSFLAKSYADLMDFNKRIWSDRQGFIANQIQELNKQLVDTDQTLVALDEERKNLLNQLKKQNVVDRYKKKRLKIAEIEDEIDSINDFLGSIINEEKIDIQKEIIKRKRKGEISKLKNMEIVGTPQYADFVGIFNSLAREVLGHKVKLIYNVNNKGNVHFDFEFQDGEGDKVMLERGTSYRKMLSIFFDIALILKYYTRNHIRFVAHDGVWDTMGDSLKEKHIKKIRELSAYSNCQFILTMLDDDIPRNYNRENYFKDNEIVLDLDDREDNTGLLFETLF